MKKRFFILFNQEKGNKGVNKWLQRDDNAMIGLSRYN